MAFGYNAKILHVQLDTDKLYFENQDESFYKKYGGGSALGLYYVLKHTPPNADPLGPENTLVMALGVVTGAPISGQSRMTTVAKSPLSGAIGDSQSGGFFPAEMKFAGVDAIVFHGKSKTPVYLYIKNGKAELRPAEHLMGKPTGEVEEILKSELGDKKVQIAQTGLAGELGVRFAAVIHMANRANGRTGMGAVMGSKNLKAVVVRGNNRPELAEKSQLIDLAKWGAKNFPESDVYSLGVYGTAEITASQSRSGGLPTRNWESGTFDTAKKIDGKTMAKTILKERDTCYACTVRCKRVVEISEGPYKVDPIYGGPEYETLATFGSYCGIDNLEAVAYANQLCNKYGMDTISCGATIAWAMDCFEKGLITNEDTGGIQLTFGNAEAMVQMVEMIANRKGFGDILALGSAQAAEKIGRGTESLTVTAKKVEFPAHMPQVKRSLGLIYAVNPFGADHQSSEHDPSYEDYPERMEEIGLTDPQPSDNLNEEKIKFALTTQYLYSALDSYNVCQFVFGPSWHLYGPEQLVKMVNAVTGWDITIADVLKVGERRLNLLRLFNALAGFGSTDDKLPPKMYQALRGGESDGVKLTKEELEQAKNFYYKLAGWDEENGTPTKDKLESLDLHWAAELLD